MGVVEKKAKELHRLEYRCEVLLLLPLLWIRLTHTANLSVS